VEEALKTYQKYKQLLGKCGHKADNYGKVQNIAFFSTIKHKMGNPEFCFKFCQYDKLEKISCEYPWTRRLDRPLCTIVAEFCVLLFSESCVLLFADYNYFLE